MSEPSTVELFDDPWHGDPINTVKVLDNGVYGYVVGFLTEGDIAWPLRAIH